MRVGELDQEEAVGEVREPEGDCGRDEREAETVHRPVEGAVELQPECVPAVEQQRDVDGERPCEVSDQDAERPLVECDDEQDGRADGDPDVRQRGGDVRGRALLDPEQRRHLVVVHRRPQPDERGDDEIRVVLRVEEHPRDLGREHDAERERQRRRGHHVPERGPNDEQAARELRRVEVKAEEGALHRLRDEGRQHGGQRDERLDQPVIARRQVARVQRQQEHAEDPRDDRAEPVDGGVAEQLAQSPAEMQGSDPLGVRPQPFEVRHAQSMEA